MVEMESLNFEGTAQNDIPKDVLDSLKNLMHPEEKVQLSASTDLRSDGTYGSDWILATDRQLYAFRPNGEEPPGIIQIPLLEIVEAQVEDSPCSGVLKVRTANKGFTLAHFTRTLIPRFSNLSKEMLTLIQEIGFEGNQERSGDSKRPTTHAEKKRCEKCGYVIPHHTNICHNCLAKSKNLTRILSYVFPFWRLASVSLILLLVATFIGLTPPLIMRTLIDDVLAPVRLNLSSTPLGTISDRESRQGSMRGRDERVPISKGSGDTAKLAGLVALLLLVNVSRNGLVAFRSYLLARLGQRITFNIRCQVYRHIHNLSLNFYNRGTGWIIHHITNDVGMIQDFITQKLQDSIVNILTLLIICCILFYLNPGLAALVLLPTPFYVLATVFFGRRIGDITRVLARRWAGLSGLLGDVIPGIRVVRSFAQEKREVNKFERKNWDLYKGELGMARIQSGFTPLMTFLTSLGTLIIWWIGGHKVIGGTLTLGDFVAFTSYMWQFYGPVESLCNINHGFRKAAGYSSRVFDILDTPLDNGDKRNASRIKRVEGRVEFRNVTFAYEPGKPVLKNINFVVEPGEMIGLAGHSGAGKTTLINLICRFYIAQEGAVLIDGCDIRNIQLKSYREQIGVVLQDTFLFNSTVAENISYGNPESSLDEIMAAAMAASAHDFIMNLPDGYETLLGERGARLSGGERQRLSIARAVLRNPRILFLDEATSNLDTETEARIQDALAHLVKERTTFAIAHRLSTLKHANRLLILNQGELGEIGTHDELIAKDGIYAKLCRMQSEMSRIHAW